MIADVRMYLKPEEVVPLVAELLARVHISDKSAMADLLTELARLCRLHARLYDDMLELPEDSQPCRLRPT